MADYKDALRDLGLDEYTIEAIQDLNVDQISGSIAYASANIEYSNPGDYDPYEYDVVLADNERLQTYYLRTEGFIK